MSLGIIIPIPIGWTSFSYSNKNTNQRIIGYYSHNLPMISLGWRFNPPFLGPRLRHVAPHPPRPAAERPRWGRPAGALWHPSWRRPAGDGDFSGGLMGFFSWHFIGISWGFHGDEIYFLMGFDYPLGTHDIYWNLAFRKDILLETKATTCRFWSLMQPFDWTGLEMVGEGWCSASTSHSMCTLAESCCPA